MSTSRINQLENEINCKEKTFEDTSKKLDEITKEKNTYLSKCEMLDSKLKAIEKQMEEQKIALTAKETFVDSLQEKLEIKQKEEDNLVKTGTEDKQLHEKHIKELKDTNEKIENNLEQYMESTKDKMSKI